MTKGVQGLKKSIIAVVTGFTVAAGILSGGITGRLGGGQQVQAAEVACTTYTGDNIEDQNYEYSQWAKPIRSYLTYENGTYMRVQAMSLNILIRLLRSPDGRLFRKNFLYLVDFMR